MSGLFFDYLLMLIIFPVQNFLIFQNFNIAFDYLLMLTIFHVPNFL